MLSMGNGFGVNTNLFETNVLNLRVVVRVVVTVVGDALRTLLDQRRQMIILIMQEADKKAIDAQKRLEEAKNAVEVARSRAQEIRKQAIQTSEQERLVIQQQLKNDLQRIQARGRQSVQLEYQRTLQALIQKVVTLALTTAESTLLTTLGSQDPNCLKQKELNEIYVRETLREIKEGPVAS